MSEMKYANLFFQKKYIQWGEIQNKIDELESEYYERFGGQPICG